MGKIICHKASRAKAKTDKTITWNPPHELKCGILGLQKGRLDFGVKLFKRESFSNVLVCLQVGYSDCTEMMILMIVPSFSFSLFGFNFCSLGQFP